MLMDESSEEQVQAQPRRGHKRKKWLWISIVAIVVLALGAGGTLIYMHQRDKTPLDKYTALVNFPVYYPSSFPAGYTLDKTSISINGDLVVYQLIGTNPKNPALVFTQQAMPADFDANKMVGKNASALGVPTGTLYDISAAQQSKYMLTTGPTLLFINANSKVDAKMINTTVSSLHEVK